MLSERQTPLKLLLRPYQVLDLFSGTLNIEILRKKEQSGVGISSSATQTT